MCLKEFCKILQGGVVRVYTDHKNLTFNILSVHQVLRWRIFMDKFGLSLGYIEGKNNVLADAFSRLPMVDCSVAVGGGNINNKNKRTGTPIDFHTIKVSKDDTLIDDKRFFNMTETFVKDKQLHKERLYFNVEEDNKIKDLFLNLLPTAEIHNLINMQNIANH